ncbi:MAG: phosphoribosylamine--glycine ligase [Firmicutes bacterium]|nr:phosphoribosylamine--glycine ligase [Bacillota bacterium]
MRVLIVGSGGREHTLAWKIAQSQRVEKVYAAPGNDGLSEVAESVTIKAGGIEDLADWAEKNRIDFTVVGPEVYLALGIADAFARRGLPLFGPSRAAARLEASKVFAKEIMAKYGIPTAPFQVFDRAEAAKEYIRSRKEPLVIKADGLAGGKGVILPDGVEEAEEAIHQLMEEKIYGDAGNRVVIEERLAGEEVTLLAVTDGKAILPLLPAQDHKRIGEGDRGPNTGGMGAYAPASVLTPELLSTVTATILEPVIRAMREEGHPYSGVLYAGLMLTKNGPQVVEFNARFGDPETQVILPMLQTDLVEVISAVFAGKLDEISLSWRPGAAACVVLASSGYPGSYQTGFKITGLQEAAGLEDLLVFHAGTERKDGIWRTNGGRVLNLVGLGATLPEALEKAYRGAELVRFPGCYYRRDIGWRELQRLQAGT